MLLIFIVVCFQLFLLMFIVDIDIYILIYIYIYTLIYTDIYIYIFFVYSIVFVVFLVRVILAAPGYALKKNKRKLIYIFIYRYINKLLAIVL